MKENKIIITINAGSSSLKWSVFKEYKKVQDGLFDLTAGKLVLTGNVKRTIKTKVNTHKAAARILDDLIGSEKHIILVHRVVHGGKTACKLNDKKIKEIEQAMPLAPLHLPANLLYMKHFKKFEQYAVFDSYYYQHQIKNETIIPLPSKLIRDKYYQIQGFHGIAHFAITRKEKGNVVTCHLGSGCSITASKNGKALATSMYQTPLSGIPMRTRTGDVDVGLLLHLAERHGAKKMRDICYHDSGLSAFVKGGDVRDILKKKRTDVIDYFSYNVSKKVASYLPILQHIDTLIFSGGIGENEHHVRTGICKYLSFLNISLDQKKNKKNAAVISDRKSKIKVKVKSADEDDTMLMILKKEKLLK